MRPAQWRPLCRLCRQNELSVWLLRRGAGAHHAAMTTALHPSPSSGQLAPGALLNLRVARSGLQLSVSSGRLWVTLQGAPDDHFITAGQTLTLPRGAQLLMECDSAVPAAWVLAVPSLPAPAAPRVPDNRGHEHARIAPPQPLFPHRPQLR
jgi:hypothetical protein